MPKIKKKCLRCGKVIFCWPYRFKIQKFCSFSCRSKSQTRWKGKSIEAYSGYKRIWNGEKYVPEHRFIIEKHIGRKLKKSEIVHHINHNPSDNRIENLEVMKRSDHASHHHAGLYKANSVKAMHKYLKEAPRCGRPIIGWGKRKPRSQCQRPIPCGTHQ